MTGLLLSSQRARNSLSVNGALSGYFKDAVPTIWHVVPLQAASSDHKGPCFGGPY
jgi:hypothetical protein